MKKLILGCLLIVSILGCNKEKNRVNIEKKEYSGAVYENMSPKQWGFRYVKENGQIFLIDSEGKRFVPSKKYESMKPIKDYILVQNNGKIGVLNRDGEELIPPSYKNIAEIEKGIFKVNNGESFALINEKNEKLTDFSYSIIGENEDGVIRAIKENKALLLNLDGKELTENKYVFISPFKEGIAIAIDENKKYSYLNKLGEEFLGKKYEYVGDFYSDLALVKEVDKYGVINKKGEEVIPTIYDKMQDLGENRYLAQKNKEEFLLDGENNVLFKSEFDSIGEFSEGLAPVKKAGRFGFIDKNGKVMIPLQYEEVGEFSNGVNFALSSDEQLYKLINKKGKEITEAKYFYISEREGKYFIFGDEAGIEGIVDNRGKEIVKEYKKLLFLSEKVAIGFTKEDKFSYIVLDEKPKIIDVDSKAVVFYTDKEFAYRDGDRIKIIEIKSES